MNEDRLDRIEARLARLEIYCRILPEAAREAAPQPSEAVTQAREAVTAHVSRPGTQRPILAGILPSSPRPRASESSLEALLAGRGLQIAGFVLVLLGAAFFLDLAFTRGWIGPAGRILLGLAAGGGLIAWAAMQLRGTYRRLAESLAGLGAGIVYLSLWASIAVFPELGVSRGLVFVAMISATALLAALATARRSQAIAVYGALGGFLTPFLLSGGPPDRIALGAYLALLAVGMLILARLRDFVAIEVLTGIGLLAYAGTFAPDAGTGWMILDAQVVATAFAAIFAIGLTAGRPAEGRHRDRRIALIVLDAFAYMLALTAIFGLDHRTLGVNLLGFSAVLLGLGRMRGLGPAWTRTYGYLGLSAVTLALPALLSDATLLDALTLEGLILFLLGRGGDTWIARAGAALVAYSGVMLAGEALLGAYQTPWTFALNAALWTGCAGSVIARLDRIVPSDVLPIIENVSRVAFDVLVLGSTSRVVDDLANGRYGGSGFASFEQLALSLVWAAYGAVLFVTGLRGRRPLFRWEALGLFGLTILKVFVIDLSALDLAYRVGSFVGLGVVLFAVSAVYTRATAASVAGEAP